MPGALVFGPAVATYTGIVSGGRYTNRWYDDPKYGRQNFLDVYLDRMRQAEAANGKRLLDVLDVHYYPAAGDGRNEIGADRATQSDSMVGARLQAPRSLWDPTYVEGSWVSGVTGGPIRFLPRLREQIAAHYPGTRIAITEYFFGRAGDISGGIAQADVLGIFGREGVFAATLWPNADESATPYNGDGSKAYAYAFGAFNLFLDFDGAGSRFGATGVAATTSDVVTSSVYASLDGQNRVVIIAINKNKTGSSTATLNVSDPRSLTRVAGVYRLVDGAPVPVSVPASGVTVRGGNSFSYVMPPLSATAIVLAP
jgi:mannan endo-1,4-beta-mannosidase